MKMSVETMIVGQSSDFVGWGMNPDGLVEFKAIVGSHRVTLAMTYDEAKQVGMCGIHAAFMVEAAHRQAAGAQANGAGLALVDPSGIPLGGKAS